MWNKLSMSSCIEEKWATPMKEVSLSDAMLYLLLSMSPPENVKRVSCCDMLLLSG